MGYRDDRQAMALYIAELERENRELKEALGDSEERARELTDAQHEVRRVASRGVGCSLCGGNLLPVALFAGHDITSPLPLSISTIRFGNPSGGFTHSAPIHSLACASCGYIHNFIDMPRRPTETGPHHRAELDRVEPDRDEPERVEPDRAEPDRAEPDRAEPDRAEPDPDE